jgi:hypothetical protein
MGDSWTEEIVGDGIVRAIYSVFSPDAISFIATSTPERIEQQLEVLPRTIVRAIGLYMTEQWNRTLSEQNEALLARTNMLEEELNETRPLIAESNLLPPPKKTGAGRPSKAQMAAQQSKTDDVSYNDDQSGPIHFLPPDTSPLPPQKKEKKEKKEKPSATSQGYVDLHSTTQPPWAVGLSLAKKT